MLLRTLLACLAVIPAAAGPAADGEGHSSSSPSSANHDTALAGPLREFLLRNAVA